MKAQKRNGKVTADELLKQIEKLQNELFTTDVQFELFVGLRKAGPNYKEEFRCSSLFWDYTVQAHITMVILRLCRIYDTDDKTFSLPIFLKTVEANSLLFSKEAFIERNKNSPNLERLAKYPRELNLKGLNEAQKSCSPSNPIVKNLLVLRHHFIAHTNYNLAFSGAEIFNKNIRCLSETLKNSSKMDLPS
ncbi:MAG: hypothetical protein ABSG87_10260 [Verrucomicrobiota bacterium]|jgi:hypothetical protein